MSIFKNNRASYQIIIKKLLVRCVDCKKIRFRNKFRAKKGGCINSICADCVDEMKNFKQVV